MTQPEDHFPAARHMVEHLYGQCVLRLQAYELLVKSVLAAHQLSAPMTDLEGARANRAAEIGRKTLGPLVGDMIGSFLVPDGQQSLNDERGDAPSVALEFHISFPAEEFARINTEHRDLVLLRNSLVHHFLTDHDLRSTDGCVAAQQALKIALDRVNRAYTDLQAWAKDMERMQEVVAEHLASADLHDFFVHDRVPWHMTTIAQALHEAAMSLAKGDWAPVDAAAGWIAECYPDEKPEGYGCRSWRQVIHETRQFDLELRKIDGRRQAFYRPRNQRSAQP